MSNRNIERIGWILLIIATSYFAWTIAPSEKVIVRDRPSNNIQCERLIVPIGETGYISHGDYVGKTGKVLGYKNYDCSYVVELSSLTIIDVDSYNFTGVKL